jgi:hypothetical protein
MRIIYADRYARTQVAVPLCALPINIITLFRNAARRMRPRRLLQLFAIAALPDKCKSSVITMERAPKQRLHLLGRQFAPAAILRIDAPRREEVRPLRQRRYLRLTPMTSWSASGQNHWMEPLRVARGLMLRSHSNGPTQRKIVREYYDKGNTIAERLALLAGLPRLGANQDRSGLAPLLLVRAGPAYRIPTVY